jgi:hypothetical protein
VLLEYPLPFILSTDLTNAFALSIPDSKSIVFCIRVDVISTFGELNTRNVSLVAIHCFLFDCQGRVKAVQLAKFIIRASHEIILEWMEINPVYSLEMSFANDKRFHFGCQGKYSPMLT